MTSWVDERSGENPAAQAARDAEIIGKPQRIETPALEDMTPEQHEVVRVIRASIGIPEGTPMPDYSVLMTRHPELFRRQLEMGTALFKGFIPARERELAVLRIAWLLQAPYEWGEHVNIGKRYGVSGEEIQRAIEGSKAPGWTEHEAAILSAVEELLADQTLSDATYDTLAKTWDDRQLLEFPMLVGQYVCTAIHQNALRIRLQPNNPGLSHR